MITRNEGTSDRIIRFSLGIILAYISLNQATGIAQTTALIIAGVLLITGLSGFCLLYTLFGIQTCHQPDNTP